MFTLGGTELLLVGVLVLLLFGPDKVPQFARTLGRAMREFNKYKDIMESAFRVEMEAAEAAESAAKEASEEGGEAGLSKIKQAAAASREFAAEHGVEMQEASELGIGVDAPEAGDAGTGLGEGVFEQAGGGGEKPAPEAPAIAARVTDEDEEEG